MALASEPIFAALFDRLKDKLAGQIQTFERRDLDYSQIEALGQPALILVEDDFVPSYRGQGIPATWTLGATILLYARASDSKTPGTILLNLRDKLEAAFERQPTEQKYVPDEVYTSLGGLVNRAWISGPVQFYPGATSEQAIAVVPVSMLWPPVR
jgi:hypothetical protein